MAGKPNTKWKETMIKKFGSEEAMLEWVRSNGARGGKISKGGGFGSKKIGKDGLTGRERAKKAGSIGGRNSRRVSNQKCTMKTLQRAVTLLVRFAS